ncbi:hypothetical protein NL676_035468 [Syzygium grande]|nr:hypothetical protein NL676_035468 [Syzygium grande]
MGTGAAPQHLCGQQGRPTLLQPLIRGPWALPRGQTPLLVAVPPRAAILVGHNDCHARTNSPLSTNPLPGDRELKEALTCSS